MNIDKVLTTSEVAKLFGVRTTTITRWIRAGELPVSFRTIGGHARFYQSDILEMINQATSVRNVENGSGTSTSD